MKESEITFKTDLNEKQYEYLQGNVINGKVAIPLSLCLANVWEVFKSFNDDQNSDIVFEDIKIKTSIVNVPDDNIINLTVTVSKGWKKIVNIIGRTKTYPQFNYVIHLLFISIRNWTI